MKAEELMVGDWVLDSYTNRPMRIEGINGGNPRFGQDLEPIPLTPEILEKIGFTNEGFFAKLVIDIRKICCDSKNISILTGEHVDLAIPCFYVHELQHALRLCGIDKEIVL